MTKRPDDETAVELIELVERVGRALHPGLDKNAQGEVWPGRLAPDLGVTRDTLRTWRRGRDANFGPDHPMLDRLLALADRRAEEVCRARDELRDFLRQSRGPTSPA